MGKAVGIDLGTTNSVVAVLEGRIYCTASMIFGSSSISRTVFAIVPPKTDCCEQHGYHDTKQYFFTRCQNSSANTEISRRAEQSMRVQSRQVKPTSRGSCACGISANDP